MKKLKSKLFFTIFIILTVFSISILFIYNYQNYKNAYKNIEENLKRMDIDKSKEGRNTFFDKEKKEPDNNFEKKAPLEERKFIDATIYTIVLEDGKIESIISHSENETNTEEIEEVAKKIIKNDNKEKYIGNLYTNKYSYSYTKDNNLIIIDNSIINSNLKHYLNTSILLFVLLESLIIIISILLTKWIIKPVVEAFKKQQQFIADSSHELKTPLAVIMASSEALENDMNEKKYLDNIKNESERMNKLILNLLDLAKIENNTKKELNINNLSKIIEKSSLTFESLCFEKNIELESNIEENIKIKCDSDEIKELMSILLDNAVKHTKSKGKININLKNEKNNIILEVQNEGEPIPKGEEEKIFERFYRVDKARNRKENRYGLGLAIAKKIVENHSGKITASSESGYTTFRIIFKKK